MEESGNRVWDSLLGATVSNYIARVPYWANPHVSGYFQGSKLAKCKARVILLEYLHLLRL